MISADAAKPDTMPGVTIPTQFTMTELAGILSLSRIAVLKRSDKENWPFIEIPHPGGTKKLFPLRTLPADIQRRVRIHFGELPEGFAECVPVDFDSRKVARCTTLWDAALDWQKDLARKRQQVLAAWEKFRTECGLTATAADRRFCELFAHREVPGIDPDVYSAVKRLKRSALHEWRKRFSSDGIAGLISQHGQHTRGHTHVPLEQQKFILGTFNNNPNLKPKKIAAVLRGKFDGTAVGTRQVRIFLNQQRSTNPQIFAFLDNPDAWRSKHQLALGSASEKAHHFLHYVEVDSTIADVTCSDGKRYNICGLIDIFSRKCKFLVTQTSSSWAIAGLLRATIMDWGLPENLVRDNGKDYGSQMITDACRALEIEEVVLPPFTPEGKPHIERVFGTLTRDLFETLPGYCGHNVAEAQAIRSRESFAERFGKGKDKAKGTGEKLFVKSSSPDPSAKTFNISSSVGCGEQSEPHRSRNLTPQELQVAIDRWVEQVYHLRSHGSLRVSPNTRAASVPVRPRRIEDPRSLDILLAPAPKGPTRTVLKKGILLENQTYWGNELIDYIGRKVAVRLDMRDAGRIFCFDPDTKAFICEALDLSISGLSVGDMIAAKKRARKRMLEGVKAMRTLAAEVGDPLAEEIRQIREERATVTNLRVGDPVTDNPFVDAANKAAAALDSKEGQEEDRGNPFLQKGFPPDPLPQNSRIFDDYKASLSPAEALRWAEAEFKYYPPAKPDNPDPKIVSFKTKPVYDPQDIRFDNWMDKFDWLRKQQRDRALTEKEVRWVKLNREEWLMYALQFVDQWPESDQVWLATIAPDRFEKYTSEEESK